MNKYSFFLLLFLLFGIKPNAGANLVLNLSGTELQGTQFANLVKYSDYIMLGIGVKDLVRVTGKSAFPDLYKKAKDNVNQLNKQSMKYFLASYMRLRVEMTTLASVPANQSAKTVKIIYDTVEKELKATADGRAIFKEAEDLAGNLGRSLDVMFDEAFESIASVQNLKKLSGVTIREIDIIGLNELQAIRITNRIDELANIAVAETNLNKTLNKINYSSHSGFDNFNSKIPNGSPSPNQNTKIFITFDAPNPKGVSMKRHNDAEVKIFEDIASQLGAKKGDAGTKIFNDVEGKIKLKTVLCPCGSCSNVIEQFKKMFPKVELEILAQSKETFK